MEPPREGSSVTRPPFLDGSNYGYWKIRMQSFISSIDGDAWNSVLTGYKDPLIADAQGNISPKVRSLWSPEELKKDTSNAKALNAIYNAIDVGQFRMISSYKTAKEVWEALETTYEGTSKVKQTKLIMLKSRFDSLLMQPDSSIAEFYKEPRDIANESFALGKTYTEFDMVMKVLTSLPAKFAPKKTAMMESNDVSKMKLEELIGSLRTYEMEIKMQDQNRDLAERARNLAFFSSESKTGDDNKTVMMLTKKIERHMKQLDMLKKEKSLSNSCSRFSKNENHSKDKRGIKCFECQGYGHLKADCANLHKHKDKSFKTIPSDSETESDEEDVSNHNVISFVAEIKESVKDTFVKTERSATEVVETAEAVETDEDVLDDEEMPSYEELLQNFVTTCSQNVSLIKEKRQLSLQIEELKSQLQKKDAELLSAQRNLEETKKGVKMLSTGTEKLDQILTVGRVGHQPQGLGYKGKNIGSKTAFVSGGIQDYASTSHKPVAERKDMATNKQDVVRKFVPICHHCGKNGHIRPRCYRYLQSLSFKPQNLRLIWVRKSDLYTNYIPLKS
ncbi:hypothetical protein V5N11_000865 [Cardamine amara subsp. amara]|uniref:CCHC-type domain-containing protein n=1 Tax=Cardamine amara subsp. amara TaxID=228776 RepID=A0ABD1BM13_CARAN